MQIEHQYDSRNRDTLTIVPGVGSYRNTFAGPNDELTASTIGSYVDSIGGVNPDLKWRYSQAGLLLSDTAQGTRVATHTHDRFGRDSLTADVNGTWAYRYHATRGVPDTVFTPFGDTLTYDFDIHGRRIGPIVRSGTNPVFELTQSYLSTGQLRNAIWTHGSYSPGGISTIDTAEARNWSIQGWLERQGVGGDSLVLTDTLTIDAFERLTGSRQMQDTTVMAADSFTFDRDGNIHSPGDSRSYDVTTTRLTSWSGGSITYDGAGNQTANGSWSYGYDALDRLVSVRWSGVLIARYAYDVMGRRIVKRVYNAATGGQTGYLRMIYAGGVVAAEADSAGTVGLRYTWGAGADDLIAIHDDSDGDNYYVVQDNLGSVRGITRRDGQWIANFRYRAFGDSLSSTGSLPFTLRYRWIGREFDGESGLYYVRARYYDAGQERFTQEDPSGYSGGPNLFAYGSNNPTNGRDLSGLEKNYSMRFQWESPTCGSSCGNPDGVLEDTLDDEWNSMNLNYLFQEGTERVGTVGAAVAYAHYLNGSGTDLSVSFAGINTSGITPFFFPAFRSALLGALGAHASGQWDVNTTRSDFKVKGSMALVLGFITLRMTGTLTLDCGGSCTWAFTGTLSADRDFYNFNASTHRSRAGEAATAFGRNVGRGFYARPYYINIVGSRPISAVGMYP